MEGSVITLQAGDIAVHIYTAPPAMFADNTIVLELHDRLIVIDGQMFQPYAEEAADMVEELGKRIDRFVLTHDHPDHYSGFMTLTARFPGVQLAALASVRQSLLRKSRQVLAVRRSLFGDQIAERAVIPDATIVPGELLVSGQRFVFAEFDDTESEHSLVIYLPDARLAVVGDLIAASHEHMFTLQPHFDNWTQALERIRGDIARLGVDTILPGHGAPLTPAVLPANLEYLRIAKQAFTTSGTSNDYKAAIRDALPDHGPQSWLDWTGQQLYGHVAP